MASTPTTSRALPPNMIQLPPAPTWGHEVSSTSSDDSDLSEDASRRRHGRTQSLAPGSPYSTTHHSRNNSSVSFTLSPRPSSPNRAYSPFSAASERDSFLPPPASSPYRTSSPSIKTELSYFFENHTPLPPTSKRGRAQWLLLLAVPAVLLVLFFTAGNTMEGSQKLSDSWGGFKEHLGEGLKELDGWKERLVSSAKSPSWKAEVKEMDVLIEEARIADKDTIEISVSPIPRIPEDGEMKYLGYLPHSGYHNQRNELVQALILGKMLNRTVLVPPCWVGWPTPWNYYTFLQETWNQAILINEASFGLHDDPLSPLFAPANLTSSHAEYPMPGSEISDVTFAERMAAAKAHNKAKWEKLGYEVRPDGFPITELTAKECKSYSPECRHTYKDTFLAWDSLVDLEKVSSDVKLVDRWDVREGALQELLGLEKDDFFVFQDEARYDLSFVDFPPQATPLPLISPHPDNSSHFARLVSVPAMRDLPQKVFLVGSLFGHDRVVGLPGLQEHDPLPEKFAQAMAFNNPWLIRPANEIRDRLGGGEGFVGVHARVGDGVFARRAPENMETTWRELVAQIGVEESVLDEMWEKVKPEVRSQVLRRSAEEEDISSWAQLDGDEDLHAPTSTLHQKRSSQRAPRSPLPSPTLRNLTCRSPLHSSSSLAPFNTPLYLATDSRSPETDPNLAIFFASFPCTFILSDFDRPSDLNDRVVVESIGDMAKLVNQADGVPLGRLFLPFLEAIVAAKGFETVGTPGSTFSIFAQGALHDAYREDPDSHPTVLREEEKNVAARAHAESERRAHSVWH